VVAVQLRLHGNSLGFQRLELFNCLTVGGLAQAAFQPPQGAVKVPKQPGPPLWGGQMLSQRVIVEHQLGQRQKLTGLLRTGVEVLRRS
jgi:hypothetical protein